MVTRMIIIPTGCKESRKATHRTRSVSKTQSVVKMDKRLQLLQILDTCSKVCVCDAKRNLAEKVKVTWHCSSDGYSSLEDALKIRASSLSIVGSQVKIRCGLQACRVVSVCLHCLFENKRKMSEDIETSGCPTSFSERVRLFQKRAEQHKKKQLENPFSQWEGSGKVHKIDKNDPNYGRPVEGSKTHQRGQKALEHIKNEIKVLCDVIRDYGEPQKDGTICIYFGYLFQLYTKISDTLVGMLLRARKYGYVQFEGEMLYQRRDDYVPIYLLRTPKD